MVATPPTHGRRKWLYLSPSAAAKYDDCPRQYRYYYHDQWRTRKTALALPFGRAVHKAASEFFIADYNGKQIYLPDVFEAEFHRQLDLVEPKEESKWDKGSLIATGRVLCDQFPDFWDSTGLMPLIDAQGPVVERKFKVSIGHGVMLNGIIDLIAMDCEGKITLIDWKTPASVTNPVFLINADQLTEYQVLGDAHAETLGINQIDQLAFGELIKRKTGPRAKKGPTIEPLAVVPRRSPQEVADFIEAKLQTAEDIRRGRFPKRARMGHNTPCGMCDFVSLCTNGDTTGLITREQQKAEERALEEFEENFAEAFKL